jgi:hypothetical protein
MANTVKDKFCNALRYCKKETVDILSKELLEEIKTNNIASTDIFTISSMFPRDSFKIPFLTNGVAEQRAK